MLVILLGAASLVFHFWLAEDEPKPRRDPLVQQANK